MKRDRVYTLAEAQADFQPPLRRPPRERAHVLPDDPAWLHEGITMRLTVNGQPTDLFCIGAVARALGRSVGTVLRLEAAGVLPQTRYRCPGRAPQGQKRLYTRAFVLALRRAALETGVADGRRPATWAGHPLREVFVTSATAAPATAVPA